MYLLVYCHFITEWSVCSVKESCGCMEQACDELEGYGFCDAERCNLSNGIIDARGDARERGLMAYIEHYRCPANKCCCKK